jgi:hypothetical protein
MMRCGIVRGFLGGWDETCHLCPSAARELCAISLFLWSGLDVGALGSSSAKRFIVGGAGERRKINFQEVS